MSRKRSWCQRGESTSFALVEREDRNLVPDDVFEQSFSENDADIPSSFANDLDSRKIKSEEKKPVKGNTSIRVPLKEVVKKSRNDSSRLSPSDTCSSGSGSDKDEAEEHRIPSKAMEQNFRRFSQELHKRMETFECDTPPMLSTKDMGSPKKVWSVLCIKDDLNKRDWMPSAHKDLTYEMRLLVIDWINEVCTDRKLHRETFHLAVDYFDRFLKVTSDIASQQLQLIATSALIIASKIEEIYPPKIYEICEHSDGGVTVDHAIMMEQIILVELNWNFNPITAIHWLSLYCQLLAKAVEGVPKSLRRRSPAMKINFEDSFNDENVFDSQATTTTISEDSFLQTIDGIPAFETSFNESMNMMEMNTSYSEGHLVVAQNSTVPKLMREEFCYLAKIVDYVMMSEYFLKYRYGDIAAAVLFCAYEPSELIEQVTGKKRGDLIEVIGLIQFFVDYCDKASTVLSNRFIFHGVAMEDQHNIQTYENNPMQHMEEISHAIKEHRKQLRDVHKVIKEKKSKLGPDCCSI